MEINGIKYKLLENTGIRAMCEACVFGNFEGDCENIGAGKLCGTGDSYFVREEDANTGDRQLTIPDVSQQRELLLAYSLRQWDAPSESIITSHEKMVDSFLANNCG